MNCTHCDKELTYHDYYGKYTMQGFSGFDKTGEIYKCLNEECDFFDKHFYTDAAGDLKEGYPC